MSKRIIKSMYTVREPEALIESFDGHPKEFRLPISDQLKDPIAINTAIITDSIRRRGWIPDGFEQKEDFRIHHHRNGE
jgi:hypothetical protein